MKSPTLRQWVATHQTYGCAREWLKRPNLEIYVRLASRPWQGNVVSTLDLANMLVKEKRRGQGVLTKFVGEAEALADELGLHLYVENVLEDRFANWWGRRGYVIASQFEGGCPTSFMRAPRKDSDGKQD